MKLKILKRFIVWVFVKCVSGDEFEAIWEKYWFKDSKLSAPSATDNSRVLNY